MTSREIARKRLEAATAKLEGLLSGDPRLSETMHELNQAAKDMTQATVEASKWANRRC